MTMSLEWVSEHPKAWEYHNVAGIFFDITMSLEYFFEHAQA